MAKRKAVDEARQKGPALNDTQRVHYREGDISRNVPGADVTPSLEGWPTPDIGRSKVVSSGSNRGSGTHIGGQEKRPCKGDGRNH